MFSLLNDKECMEWECYLTRRFSNDDDDDDDCFIWKEKVTKK